MKSLADGQFHWNQRGWTGQMSDWHESSAYLKFRMPPFFVG
ncbi:MAG: hypothetical protein ABSH52_25675 [Terriglobia bacterium]